MKAHSDIYGLRAVIEAIKAGESIDKIFLQQGLKGALSHELETLIRKNGLNSSYVPREKLNRLAGQNHQGVVAQISPIAFRDFENLVDEVSSGEKSPFFLLLDGVTDVRNFGGIIRSAACAGLDGIIIQRKGSAPLNADTVKTSAGAVFKVPIARVNHLKDAVYYLQASGVRIFAATEKAEDSLYDVSFRDPCAIIMGAEDTGIHPSILKIADRLVKIPLMGDIASLNVSVASGIFLFEALRQRAESGL